MRRMRRLQPVGRRTLDTRSGVLSLRQVPVRERHGAARQAHAKAVECRNKALPCCVRPANASPFRTKAPRSTAICANLSAAAEPPVVVMCMGLDSAKEEMDDYENRFLQAWRGDARVRRSGAGRGRVRPPDLPRIREAGGCGHRLSRNRSDIDAKRVGVWGVSLGGYYAPRAACFEKRIKACVALSGAFRAQAVVRRAAEHQRRGVPRSLAQPHTRRGRQDRACA